MQMRLGTRFRKMRRSSDDGAAEVSLYFPGVTEEQRPASVPLAEASGSLGCRLETHTCVGKVHEGDAAFGCLAELAARRGSAAMTTAPQEDLQSARAATTPSPPSSLTRRIVVPTELCKPPYSREWLLAHREHCGGSPLRPGAFAARVVPTGERACSSGCGSTSCGEEPLQEPSQLATLEETQTEPPAAAMKSGSSSGYPTGNSNECATALATAHGPVDWSLYRCKNALRKGKVY